MIPLQRDPDGGLEPCAVQGAACERLTALWTALPERGDSEQVACCRACSGAARASDVPTKAEWFARCSSRSV